jgi:hypothetical protein
VSPLPPGIGEVNMHTFALGSWCRAKRRAASRAYFRDSSIPRKLCRGFRPAAPARNRPLPDPISSSTGCSLPKSAFHSIGASSWGTTGSTRCEEMSVSGRERVIVRASGINWSNGSDPSDRSVGIDRN